MSFFQTCRRVAWYLIQITRPFLYQNLSQNENNSCWIIFIIKLWPNIRISLDNPYKSGWREEFYSLLDWTGVETVSIIFNHCCILKYLVLWWPKCSMLHACFQCIFPYLTLVLLWNISTVDAKFSDALAWTESCRCGLVHWRTAWGFDHDRPVRSRRADKANSTVISVILPPPPSFLP